VPVLAGLFAFGQVYVFAIAARRYAVGTRGPLVYLTDPTWTTPLPQWLLLLVVLAASTALAVQLVRSPEVGPPSVTAGGAQVVAPAPA
jgi:hypothetical protein